MDEREQELIDKASAYVTATFGGDYKAAFDDFDLDDDGKIGHDELVEFLKACGIGSKFTRGVWARGAMDAVDTDKDGRITWTEFQQALTSSAP